MDDHAEPVCCETLMTRIDQRGDDGRESYFYECVQCGDCTNEYLILESETDYDD